MTKPSIKYSKSKQREIEAAIEKLENSSQEYQKIGPEDISVRTWVTRSDSELGKKISSKESNLKEYLPYKYNDIWYCIFAFPREE
jgi:hypothetical protein